MKKGLISLVAAASLICSTTLISTPSFAGTVQAKGNTKVTLYGFVRSMFSWNTQMSNDPDHSNMPIPDHYTYDYNKTKAQANALWSRLGLKFKNKDANLSGRIEGDFAHGSDFRLRLAYIKHDFCNFYVIVGQDWVVEEMHASIDPTAHKVAGFDEDLKRQPQVQIGSKIDLGSADIDIALAFEYGAKKVVGKEVNRVVIPYSAARAALHFNTGFGSPAQVYAWGSLIPVHITTGTLNDKSKTSYAFGTGIKLPVSILTFGFNYKYEYGAVGYAGLTNFSPKSWYDSNGAKATKTNAFNINLIVKPVSNIAIGAEYDSVEFKNNDVFTNGDKPKVDTYLGIIKVKTTKYTTLAFEYRHIRAKKFDAIPDINVNDNDFSGNQIFVLCKYVF